MAELELVCVPTRQMPSSGRAARLLVSATVYAWCALAAGHPAFLQAREQNG